MIRWFYIVFLALLFACDTSSNVQSPNKNYFIKYFGGDGDQIATDLIVNKDGTFFILGNSKGPDGSAKKVYLAKVNEFGELIWQKTYGTSVDTEAKDFLLTADGQYIVVVANRATSSSGTDALLTRYTLDGIKNANDSILITNAFANSVTELSDGGYIVEGYQTFNGQHAELHFRWSGNPWGSYTGGVWSSTYSDPNNKTADFTGVSTIQLSPTTFYTFGYTNAIYQSGNTNNKFWAYHLGQYGGTGGGVTDNGTFDRDGYSATKTLKFATQAAIGGYLLVGVSSSTSDNIKVSITSSDTTQAFKPSWVLQDVLLKDVKQETIDLGKGDQFVTACSSTLHNFILANIYSASNTPTPTSDILLMKINNALVPMWGDPVSQEANYVLFGGDGNDTAAAVAELADGHIMVLGTMQLGNPPAQSKIALMKLNANGKLAD